jgi:multicomponent Na+:H+ antiporter subunit E
MFGLHLLLALGLSAIAGGASILTVLTAFAVIHLFFRILKGVLGLEIYVAQVQAGAHFGVWFIGAIFRASVDVARHVLARKITVAPAIIRLPIRVHEPRQRTLLSALITLTPGTLSLATLPEDENALYIHVLHAEDEKAVLDDLQGLEARLLAWFDAGKPSPTGEPT